MAAIQIKTAIPGNTVETSSHREPRVIPPDMDIAADGRAQLSKRYAVGFSVMQIQLDLDIVNNITLCEERSAENGMVEEACPLQSTMHGYGKGCSI
jgi:hypothetical protein